MSTRRSNLGAAIVFIVAIIVFTTWQAREIVRCHNAGGEYVRRTGCNSQGVCVQPLEEIRP